VTARHFLIDENPSPALVEPAHQRGGSRTTTDPRPPSATAASYERIPNRKISLPKRRRRRINANSVKGVLSQVSQPTPLHPADSLERALDDMRQSVAALGDEGLVMRVLTMQIRLALLSILDMLIDLLADFRAGRLPPLLPALDRSTITTKCEPANQRTVSPPPASGEPAGPAPPRNTSRQIDAPAGTPSNSSADAGAGAPEQCTAQAPSGPASPPSPPTPPIRGRENAPRGAEFHPSHVPRSPAAEPGVRLDMSTHVSFVANSLHSGYRAHAAMSKPARSCCYPL
jgi:hypothetical protein